MHVQKQMPFPVVSAAPWALEIVDVTADEAESTHQRGRVAGASPIGEKCADTAIAGRAVATSSARNGCPCASHVAWYCEDQIGLLEGPLRPRSPSQSPNPIALTLASRFCPKRQCAYMFPSQNQPDRKAHRTGTCGNLQSSTKFRNL